MITVSVSKLDYFRLFADPNEQERLFKRDDYLTPEDMEAVIRDTKEQSKKGALGEAFHDIIQKPELAYEAYQKAAKDGTFGFLAPNGIVFPYNSITPCTQSIDYNFPFEISGDKIYQVGNTQVKVTCRADQLKLRNINDFKSIYRNFDYDKFLNSYQWRFYLDIFEANEFCYYVWEFNPTSLELKDTVDPFSLYPYPGLQSDIIELIDNFLYYTRKFNLIQYLERHAA